MKKIIASLLCFGVMSATVSASECVVVKQEAPGKVNVEAKAESVENVLFQVLPYDINLNEADDDDIYDAVGYFRSINADDNGEIKFDFKLNQTGEYILYSKFNNKENVEQDTFYYTTKEAYQNIIERLNAAGDADAVFAILSNTNDTSFSMNGVNNLKALNFNTDTTTDVDLQSVSVLLHNSIQDNELSVENAKENSVLFDACVGIEILSEVDNVYPYINEFLSSIPDFKELAQMHITLADAEKKFTAALKKALVGREIEKPSDIITAAKKALVLTAVKYPAGAGVNIYTVMEKYNGIFSSDILPLKSSSAIYNELKGKDFDSISELETAYKAAVKKVAAGNQTAGGGQGGGNSSSIVNKGGESIPSGTSSSKNDALKLKFEDLDGVDWAYSAISKLYEKGIINGYSDTKFKPNNTVKREEFVKMLVCTLGIEGEDYVASFSDVVGDWCEKYVSIAFNHKLVNGVSKDVFGKGNEISRQDMAVMVYNAMVSNGYTPTGAEYGFSDECAAYAKNAISELSALGIINGIGDERFDPYGSSTRAQAAVIISRAEMYLR